MKRSQCASILMLVENFTSDRRVIKEAATLKRKGYHIAIIALGRKGEKRHEVENGIEMYRLPILSIFKKSSLSHSGLWGLIYRLLSSFGYLIEYYYFTTACFFLSILIAATKHFDVIHLHNPPNTLIVVGIFFRLLGKKLVFDHHDLEPELYLSHFKIGRNIVYHALVSLEILCVRAANLVIATNESYKEIDIGRGKITPKKVYVVRNGPDLSDFHFVPPDKQLRELNKTILLYVGVMGPQDGIDYMLRAISHLVYELKRRDFLCIIVGHGDSLEDMRILSKKLRLQEYVRFTGFIPQEDLLRYLSTADICLDPNPSSPLNDVSTWIKVMEYMAFGKPTVSFALKETRVTAGDAVAYVKPNDEASFAEAVLRLMNDPTMRDRMGRYGRERVEKTLSWQRVSKNLLEAYSWLLKSSD